MGAITLVGLLAVACTPASPPTAPPPAPTSPTPTETKLERQTRLDFEAAEHSYRAFRAEYSRVARAGGTAKATPTMRKYAAGPYLRAMTDISSQARKAGKKTTSNVRIVYVRKSFYKPSEVTLSVCEDGRSVKSVNQTGEVVGTGIALKLKLVVKRHEGSWRVWDGDDKKVASCVD